MRDDENHPDVDVDEVDDVSVKTKENTKRKAGEKLTGPDRLRYKEEAFELYILGHTYREIAEKIDCGCTHSNVHFWIQSMLRERAAERGKNQDSQQEAMGAQYDYIIRSALRDMRQTVEIEYNHTEKKLERTLVDRVDPRAGRLAIDAIKAKAKLFGMNMPEKIQVEGKLDLKQLVQQAASFSITKAEGHTQDAEFEPVDQLPSPKVEDSPQPEPPGVDETL